MDNQQINIKVEKPINLVSHQISEIIPQLLLIIAVIIVIMIILYKKAYVAFMSVNIFVVGFIIGSLINKNLIFMSMAGIYAVFAYLVIRYIRGKPVIRRK
jgi:hypothetical protein